MVVDDIQDDSDPVSMGGLHQLFEPVCAPVVTLECKRV